MEAPTVSGALPSPLLFGDGQEELLDLTGLDEDLLFNLLGDADDEMLLESTPQQQEQQQPPPPCIQSASSSNNGSSPLLEPLPVVPPPPPLAQQQQQLLQPTRPVIAPRPTGNNKTAAGKKPLILPRGATAGAPIAPRVLSAAATTVTAGVKRKASSSSSSSSSLSGVASEKDIVAMEVEKAVAALEEQGVDAKELKKQRRLIRNRVASQLHRERQRAHMDGLQAQLQEKDGRIAKLQAQVSSLELAVAQSRAEAAALRRERDALLSASLHTHHNPLAGDGYSSSATTASAASEGASPSPSSLDHGGNGSGSASGASGYTSDDLSSSSSSSSATHSPRFSWGSSSSTSTTGGGGFPLFGALFLFTFLAAPSTLLLGFRGRGYTARGDGLGGLLPQRPAVALMAAPTAGPLVSVNSVRDLALPFVPPSIGSSSSKGGEEERGDKKGSYWPPVLYGPHWPAEDDKNNRRDDSSSSSSYLISPLERKPGKWRRTKEGGAPWQYSEALDIIPSSSSSSNSSSRSTSRHIWQPQPQPAPTTTRLRSRATLKDASGRPAEEKGVEGERQVDFYMGRTRREAEKEQEGKGRGEGEASYLFCPQAFGLMEQGLGSEYWRHVEAFLALPEGEQRAVMLQQRRVLSQEQQEEEGRRMNSTVTGEVNNDPHQLMLLVPARAVDWGNGGQQPQQGGDAWLEVGCRLTSMRLVTDVRFPPSASSL